MKPPIFFAYTRSFWAFIVTVLLTIHETGEPMVRAIATPLALASGADPEVWTGYGITLLPLITMGFALQQRMGAARPYTIDPRARD